MISLTKPADFKAKFEAVGVFVQYQDRYLFLLRNEGSAKGNWALPGGSIENLESEKQAAVRELAEETGIKINSTQVVYFGKLFFRQEAHDFIWYTFGARVYSKPDVAIRIDEHDDFLWLTLDEVLAKSNLIYGLREIVELCFYQKEDLYSSADNSSPQRNLIKKVAGIFFKDRKMLVERSKGRNWFMVPGGLIEKNESSRQALVREAKEELNIKVEENDLEKVGVYPSPDSRPHCRQSGGGIFSGKKMGR